MARMTKEQRKWLEKGRTEERQAQEERRRYNGWINYETWLVALWIGNEEGSSRYWDESAAECWAQARKDTTFSRAENAIGSLARRLEEEIKEGEPDLPASLYSDLLTSTWFEVSWHTIAEHMIDEVRDSAAA